MAKRRNFPVEFEWENEQRTAKFTDIAVQRYDIEERSIMGDFSWNPNIPCYYIYTKKFNILALTYSRFKTPRVVQHSIAGFENRVGNEHIFLLLQSTENELENNKYVVHDMLNPKLFFEKNDWIFSTRSKFLINIAQIPDIGFSSVDFDTWRKSALLDFLNGYIHHNNRYLEHIFNTRRNRTRNEIGTVRLLHRKDDDTGYEGHVFGYKYYVGKAKESSDARRQCQGFCSSLGIETNLFHNYAAAAISLEEKLAEYWAENYKRFRVYYRDRDILRPRLKTIPVNRLDQLEI